MLQQVSGGYQFRTRTQFSAWVQQLIAGRPVRLSRAQLETLAIIAYRQPITRPEIDEIAVDSSATLKLLLDRSLIRVSARGGGRRPMLYGRPRSSSTLSLAICASYRRCASTRLTDESRRVMSDELGLDPTPTRWRDRGDGVRSVDDELGNGETKPARSRTWSRRTRRRSMRRGDAAGRVRGGGRRGGRGAERRSGIERRAASSDEASDALASMAAEPTDSRLHGDRRARDQRRVRALVVTNPSRCERRRCCGRRRCGRGGPDAGTSPSRRRRAWRECGRLATGDVSQRGGERPSRSSPRVIRAPTLQPISMKVRPSRHQTTPTSPRAGITSRSIWRRRRRASSRWPRAGSRTRPRPRRQPTP